MRRIYLDNSATTPLCDSAIEAMEEAMREYGNPSSLHSIGLEAQKIVDDARGAIGTALGVKMMKPGQLVFTSGGTEANNLAIRGVVYAKTRNARGKIITTDSEHASVEEVMKSLEKDGFEVVRISTRGGVLNFSELEAALDERVILASMMMVNNETGAVYDLGRAFSAVKAKCPNAVTHCDAIQGFLKIKFSPTSLGADLVSVSAHKIHGPKGVGALYISRDILTQKKIAPILYGGGQEFGFRSGTENVIGIVGFGGAVKAGYRTLEEQIEHLAALREYAILKLSALDLRLNIPLGTCAPHIVNLTLPRIKSETMLHFLSGEGVYVSSGSACSSHAHTPSRALTAFGLSANDADCSLRISFSHENTEDEIDVLTEAVKSGLAMLVRIKK